MIMSRRYCVLFPKELVCYASQQDRDTGAPHSMKFPLSGVTVSVAQAQPCPRLVLSRGKKALFLTPPVRTRVVMMTVVGGDWKEQYGWRSC